MPFNSRADESNIVPYAHTYTHRHTQTNTHARTHARTHAHTHAYTHYKVGCDSGNATCVRTSNGYFLRSIFVCR
jgi:hypothetical protein